MSKRPRPPRRPPPRRVFPTDAEVEEWIAEHLLGDESTAQKIYGVSRADQMAAGQEETFALSRGIGQRMIDMGLGREMVSSDDPWAAPLQLRQVVRAYLAAERFGIHRLCPHAQPRGDIGPMLLSLDPPSICCRRPGCADALPTYAEETGFRFQNQCDVCGCHSRVVCDWVTNFGTLLLIGHVCPSCRDIGIADLRGAS